MYLILWLGYMFYLINLELSVFSSTYMFRKIVDDLGTTITSAKNSFHCSFN